MPIGSLNYDSQATVTTPITLENERRFVPAIAANQDRVEFWLNLDKDAQPQVDTLTIDEALPIEDAYYIVTVAGPTTTKTFTRFYDSASADTADTIAADLAALVSMHPEVEAAQGGTGADNTVVVTASLPGTNGAFTTTVDCLAAATNSTIASEITMNSVAGTGTGKLRKVAQLQLMLKTQDGSPAIEITGSWFDGAAVPVVATNFPGITGKSSKKMDAYREMA